MFKPYNIKSKVLSLSKSLTARNRNSPCQLFIYVFLLVIVIQGLDNVDIVAPLLTSIYNKYVDPNNYFKVTSMGWTKDN